MIGFIAWFSRQFVHRTLLADGTNAASGASLSGPAYLGLYL